MKKYKKTIIFLNQQILKHTTKLNEANDASEHLATQQITTNNKNIKNTK